MIVLCYNRNLQPSLSENHLQPYHNRGTAVRANKPEKPTKDFPLTAHPAGVWVKKIKGKLYRFGGWGDPDAALAEYLRQKDYLQAGQEPPPKEGTSKLTLIELCDEFLDSKALLVQSGELTRRMHFDYLKSCKNVTTIFGRHRIVEDLKPKDFDLLRAKLSKDKTGDGHVSKTTLANRIRLARILFKFAADQDLIPKPLKFGQNFDLPDRATLRKERNEKPSKMFEADELRQIIEKAGIPLKAMVLLGVNCGFGQSDCATLPLSAVDLKTGWIEYPRPKTHVRRRCPLWPETTKALQQAIAKRPAPKDESLAGLVFITKYGQQFVRIGETGAISDAVGAAFAKVLTDLGLGGNHRSFYSLRRTFETIGGDSRDQVAVDYIMGHAPTSDDMAAVYRQRIDDERLKSVTEHVRQWLRPKAKRKVAARTKKPQ